MGQNRGLIPVTISEEVRKSTIKSFKSAPDSFSCLGDFELDLLNFTSTPNMDEEGYMALDRSDEPNEFINV